jgi:hypothetical protein
MEGSCSSGVAKQKQPSAHSPADSANRAIAYCPIRPTPAIACSPSSFAAPGDLLFSDASSAAKAVPALLMPGRTADRCRCDGWPDGVRSNDDAVAPIRAVGGAHSSEHSLPRPAPIAGSPSPIPPHSLRRSLSAWRRAAHAGGASRTVHQFAAASFRPGIADRAGAGTSRPARAGAGHSLSSGPARFDLTR